MYPGYETEQINTYSLHHARHKLNATIDLNCLVEMAPGD